MSMFDKPLTVLVTEKPSTSKIILPIAQALWPEQTVSVVETHYIGCYEFNYPRGLGFADVPFVQNPRWKLRENLADPAPLLRAAERIICATDPDPSGAIAFHTLIHEALGEDASTKGYPVMHLEGRDLYALMCSETSNISEAFKQLGNTDDPAFMRYRLAGQARKFFDYNFNINAMMLFRRALHACGSPSSARFGISKYGLQLLYFLRTQPALHEVDVLATMQNWKGTGRYGETGMGSPASRHQILVNLINHGLLDKGYTSNARYRTVMLSPMGALFLNCLHPDCEDADLPHRIKQWESTWPASRPSIEQYLRRFFGKQKRYSPLRNAG